jgi:hypothetical protein
MEGSEKKESPLTLEPSVGEDEEKILEELRPTCELIKKIIYGS